MSPAQLPSLLTALGGRANQPLPRKGYKLPHMLHFSFSFSPWLFISPSLVLSIHFPTASDWLLVSLFTLVLSPACCQSFFFFYSCECICACLFILASLWKRRGVGGCWTLGKANPCNKQVQFILTVGILTCFMYVCWRLQVKLMELDVPQVHICDLPEFISDNCLSRAVGQQH